MTGEDRAQADAETRAVLSELEQLMAEIRANVTALQAILNTPEVPGDHAAAAST